MGLSSTSAQLRHRGAPRSREVHSTGASVGTTIPGVVGYDSLSKSMLNIGLREAMDYQLRAAQFDTHGRLDQGRCTRLASRGTTILASSLGSSPCSKSMLQ